jgi:hypothetical protein
MEDNEILLLLEILIKDLDISTIPGLLPITRFENGSSFVSMCIGPCDRNSHDELSDSLVGHYPCRPRRRIAVHR